MLSAIGFEDQTVDKQSTPILGSPNKLKLAVFSFNSHGGASFSAAPGIAQATWPEQVRLAQMADRAGIEALIPVARWRAAGESSKPGRHRSFETFTWAAGLGAVTERIQVFATVHVPTAHPIRVAKEVATVDHITGGRFGLNIVAGWNEPEFAMFGLQQREHDERYAAADEWITFAKRLWTEDEPFDFRGQFIQGRDALSEPKPVQKPWPTIMSAGFSPAGREFAAQHADLNFAVFPDRAGAKDLIARVKGHALETYGREIKLFGAVSILCRDSEAEAQRDLHRVVYEQGDWEAARNAVRILLPNSQTLQIDVEEVATRAVFGAFGGEIVGTPERVVEELAGWSEVGLDGVTLAWVDYDEGLQQYAEVLRPMLIKAGLRQD